MRPAIRRLAVPVLALGLLGAMAVPSATAFTAINVNSLSDVVANDGVCTLREAITSANTDTASGAAAGECAAGSGADQIHFSVSGTLTLTSALPDITSDVLITGASASSNTINGASSFRVFRIDSGTVTFADLTITGGRTLTTGGAILNGGTLTVTLAEISGSTGGNGGGIENDGTLSVTFSTISGNAAGNFGGGIQNNGTAVISNSTISGNTAGNYGGGIHNSGTLTLTNATISANTGRIAGGIAAYGVDTLLNTIVAGNTATQVSPDTDGFVETATTSLIGVPAGKTLADVLVPAGLANNGGPTKTIALALVAGNPAIDSGTAGTCAAAPVNGIDQRGEPRPAACDIGAYEAQPPIIAAHADVKVAVSPPAPTVVTYTKPAGTDEQGGVAAVSCTPPSGSSFPVGTTTVTCTASDAAGHTGSGSFQVIVTGFAGPSAPTARPTPTPTPTPEGSVKAATPVPSGSLANTAFSAPASTSGGTLLAGFLLLVSLVALAAVNARRRRRRR